MVHKKYMVGIQKIYLMKFFITILITSDKIEEVHSIRLKKSECDKWVTKWKQEKISPRTRSCTTVLNGLFYWTGTKILPVWAPLPSLEMSLNEKRRRLRSGNRMQFGWFDGFCIIFKSILIGICFFLLLVGFTS